MKKILSFLSLSFLLLIRELKERYIGTYMGIMWGIVQPGVTLVVMWVVFGIGFKVMPGVDYPFIVWLIPGYIAWQYMSEGIISGTSAIIERGYLVKQMVFRVEVLPVVKIMSALVVHVIFVMVMVVVLWVKGYEPRLGNLQVVYYVICGTGLAYGLSMLSGEYFWERPVEMMRYWLIMVVVIMVGRYVFSRMRGHFADVL